MLYDEDSHPIRIDSESPVAAGSPDKAVVSASCGKTTEESLVEEKSGLDSFKSPSPLQIRDPITDERVAAAAKEDEDINRALQRSLEEVNEEGILLIHAQDESVRALDDVVAVSHHEADASWSCLQCTYLNEGVAATCDMCNSVRPRAKVYLYKSHLVMISCSNMTDVAVCSRIKYWKFPTGDSITGVF